jgi:type I restriction enzyme S subunit
MAYLDPEFSPLPDGWTSKELQDVVEIHNTKRQPLNGREREGRKGIYPYCGANGVVDYIDDYRFDGEYVLIAEDGGYWGKHQPSSYIMRGKFWVNNHAHVVCAKDGETTNVFFSQILNYLNIDPFIGGDARGKLTKAILTQLAIPLPPLPEQKKIAHILSTVQRAIEAQERIIQTTTELKKALMHKLFTEGLRHEPQKQTEIGPVPESWSPITLGELCEKPNGALQTGPFGSQLHKHEYQEDGIAVVNPTHLAGNRINHENVPRVSEQVAQRLGKHRLRKFDILFARRGEIGRQGLVTEAEETWLCGTGCFLVRASKPFIDNRFLALYFATDRLVKWLYSHAAGAIMPNLNNAVMQRLPVFYPDLESQTTIIETFTTIDQKLSTAERRQTALQDLFRTLLHELMTAKTRVH